MPQYKDTNNNVHQIEEGFEYLMAGWPTGFTKITDEEATLILNPPLTLDQAKAAQIAILEAAYAAAIQLPVTYMATTFQCDDYSRKVLAECVAAGAVLTGFYWLDSVNAKTEMTFIQLQGLANAMFVQNQPKFDNLFIKKTAVKTATTVAEVQAVVW